MAKMKKFILGFLVVSGLLFVVAAVLVKVLVTPERVRTLVQTGLEESLQRPVSLGAIHISFFSGIQIEGLNIREKNSADVLLSAQDIELSYNFKALFQGELQLGQILIKEPQLRLVRDADGRLNIEDLIHKDATAGNDSDTPTNSTAVSSVAPIPLIVKRIRIEGGSLVFLDRKLNAASPYRYRLDELDIDVENFALEKAFPVRLSAKLNDAPLSMAMQVSLEHGLQHLRLDGHQLDLVPFLPYLRDFLPGTLGRGLISTSLSIDKAEAAFVVKGQVVLEQVDISLNPKNPLHWNQVRIAVDQDLTYHTLDQVIEVKRLQVDIDGLKANYRGKVLLNQKPQIAGEAQLKISDLREVSSLLPLELRQRVSAFGAAGVLEVNCLLEGEPVGVDVVRQATLEVKELQASIGGLRPALNGMLSFAAGRVIGKQLRVDLNDQHLQLDLEVTQPFSSLPHLELLVTSELFDLDLLAPKLSNSVSPAPVIFPVSPGGLSASATSDVPLVLPLSARAQVLIKKLLFRGVSFDNIQGQMVSQDGLFRIEKLTAGLAGGKAKLTTVMSLVEVGFPLSGDLNLEGINVSTLTDVLIPKAKGSISGNLTATSHFSAFVDRADPLADLQANGQFNLLKGEIKGSPLLAEFSGFLLNPELEVVGFTRFSGTYGVKRRQGSVDSLLESRRMTIAPEGTFTFDGGLNLSLETRIAPELMAKNGVSGKGLDLLKDDLGWSLIPLKVKGTYSEPRLLLDSATASKQLTKGLAHELGRELQKKLGGKTDDPQKQQIQELLDNTLNKLFGK